MSDFSLSLNPKNSTIIAFCTYVGDVLFTSVTAPIRHCAYQGQVKLPKIGRLGVVQPQCIAGLQPCESNGLLPDHPKLPSSMPIRHTIRNK